MFYIISIFLAVTFAQAFELRSLLIGQREPTYFLEDQKNKVEFDYLKHQTIQSDDFKFIADSYSLGMTYGLGRHFFLENLIEYDRVEVDYKDSAKLVFGIAQEKLKHFSQLRFDSKFWQTTLSAKYSFSDNVISDLILKNENQINWNHKLKSVWGIEYYNKVNAFNIWYFEFPNYEQLNVNVVNKGFAFWLNSQISLNENLKLKGYAKISKGFDDDYDEGYQLKIKANTINLGTVLNYENYQSNHNLKIAITSTNLESEGVRKNNDELKRFSYAEMYLSNYELEYAFKTKYKDEFSIDYSYGLLKQDSNKNSKDQRKETVSYNRIFPAGLGVIVGSSWLNFSANNKFEMPYHLLTQQSNLLFALNSNIELNVIYEHLYLNAKAKGVWYEIEDKVFVDKIYDYPYDYAIGAYVQNLKLNLAYSLNEKNEMQFAVEQLIPIWLSFKDNLKKKVEPIPEPNPVGPTPTEPNPPDNKKNIESSSYGLGDGFGFRVKYIFKF